MFESRLDLSFAFNYFVIVCKSKPYVYFHQVESLAILLEQSPQLKFLSINLDHNELEDVDISTDKIPALYFSFR